jgi:hypothetical protein
VRGNYQQPAHRRHGSPSGAAMAHRIPERRLTPQRNGGSDRTSYAHASVTTTSEPTCTSTWRACAPSWPRSGCHERCGRDNLRSAPTSFVTPTRHDFHGDWSYAIARSNSNEPLAGQAAAQRWHVGFTLTSSSWLNLVEQLSELTATRLRASKASTRQSTAW